ncbi:MAG: helix-turn-helix transcriptional regulator, partial [Spirochaetota bacterium]
LEQFSSIGDINEQCGTLFQLIDLLQKEARYDEAIDTALRGYELASKIGDEYSCALLSCQLSLITAERGDIPQSRSWLDKGISSSSRIKNHFSDCLVCHAEAVIRLRTGDPSSAFHYAENGIKIATEQYIPGYYSSALYPILCVAAAGAFPEKDYALRRRLRAFLRSTMKWTLRRSEALFARGYCERAYGSVKAEHFFARAEKEALLTGRPQVAAMARVQRARTAALSENNACALDLYEKSFYFYEESLSLKSADDIITVMRNIPGGPERVERITARRRLDFLSRAQELSFSGNRDAALKGIVALCISYTRAQDGDLFLAEEDLFRLRPCVSPSADEDMIRCARDVYIEEESVFGDLIIGFPFFQGGNVVGALCLRGEESAKLSASGQALIISALRLISRVCSENDLPPASRTEKKFPSVSADDERIVKVVEYIKENFRYDISREGLASLAGLHPDNLGKMFKIYTGRKIGDFINGLRIEEAMDKLAHEDIPVIDIAFVVGFESLRTFNRAFSAYAGVSPSEYRMSVRNREEIW